MIRLVESADAGKAKIVRRADRWATWIVITALAAAAVTWVMTGEILRAVTVLVVFCPCALVLATPTAIVAGSGNAARHGILISQGDALERLAQVRRVAFDKTGTLTYGKPGVVKILSFVPGSGEAELLEIAAAAEVRSEHPLGKAIAAHFQRLNGRPPAQPDCFELIAGRGVAAKVGGRTVYAGNEALLKERGITMTERYGGEIEAVREKGGVVVFVADGREVLGVIALADTLRPDAAETVRKIRAAGADIVLLTGDTEQAARAAADAAGIADYRAGCLPGDKLTAVRLYRERGEYVCMVGDGINDAPALKAALAGVAMGGVGSDIAIEAADAVLVKDDISEIPHLLALSAKVTRTININLFFAMALNFAAIALAVSGVLTPVTGALAHNAGSVAVIIHSALLINWRGKRR
jgi:heavy metal translocating P-type ATPase